MFIEKGARRESTEHCGNRSVNAKDTGAQENSTNLVENNLSEPKIYNLESSSGRASNKSATRP